MANRSDNRDAKPSDWFPGDDRLTSLINRALNDDGSTRDQSAYDVLADEGRRDAYLADRRYFADDDVAAPAPAR